MAKPVKEKDPLNFVHQNAILCETIMKEHRHQKLYSNYSVNPFKQSKSCHAPLSLYYSDQYFSSHKISEESS